MKSAHSSKKVVPFNTASDGICRTIRAQYYKNGFRNFTFFQEGGFGATGVLEYCVGCVEDSSCGVL
jgi:hypothetical protein